jgi:hypothetical protein
MQLHFFKTNSNREGSEGIRCPAYKARDAREVSRLVDTKCMEKVGLILALTEESSKQMGHSEKWWGMGCHVGGWRCEARSAGRGRI